LAYGRKLHQVTPASSCLGPTVFLCVQDLFTGGRRLQGLTVEGSGKRTSAGRPAEVEAKGYEPQVSPPSMFGGRHATPDMCRRFV
jgi:hypothetical protein